MPSIVSTVAQVTVQVISSICKFYLKIYLGKANSKIFAVGSSSGHQLTPTPSLAPTLSSSLINLSQVIVHAKCSMHPSYRSAIPDIYHFTRLLPYLERLTLRLHFEVHGSFFLHEGDVLLLLQMLQGPHPDRASNLYIKLHISAAQSSQKTVPRSEIVSSIERKNPGLMEMVDRGSLSIVAEDHFCTHLSCCD